jgi:hypothetical protein
MVYRQISEERKDNRRIRGVEQQVEQCGRVYWGIRNVCTDLNLKLYSEMIMWWWAESGVRLPKCSLS